MRLHYLNYLFLIISVLVSCTNAENQTNAKGTDTTLATPTIKVAQKQMYRTLVDDLRIRESADLNGKVVTKVPYSTMLEDLKEKSTTEVEVELQGEKKKGYWVKVRTSDGKTGWVHSAAVELIHVIPRYQIAADADKAKVQSYADFLAKLPLNVPESYHKALVEYDNIFKAANVSTSEFGYTKLAEFGNKIEQSSWDWKELNQLSSTAEYEKIYDTVQKVYRMDYSPYTKRLAAAGLMLDNSEGMFWAQPAPDSINKHIVPKVSTAMKEYLAQNKKEVIFRNAEDAGLIITPQEVAERMIFWENFAEKYPKFLLRNDAENNFIGYVELLIFGLNNTPAYGFENNALDPEFETAYKWLFKNHPNSKGAKAIQEIYTFYQQNKGKVDGINSKQKEVMAKLPYLNFEE